MIALVRKSAIQYGLVMALLVALTYGMLIPAEGARANAQGGSAQSGTPVAAGTPIPAPAPPVPSVPPSSEPDEQAPDTSASAPTTPPAVASATPGTTVAPVAVIPATPQAATLTFAPRPGPPGTPAVTPTTASGTPAPATPRLGTPTSPPLTTSPTATARLTPTVTPTRRPGGTVSAVIIRDLSALSFTLNGRDQIAQATLDIAVSDIAPATRQPGWSLTLSVDQFRIAGHSSRSLPADAVTLLGVTVTCADVDGCTMPENTIAYPFIMPDHAAVAIVSAAPGSGGGQFVITPTFAVRVPAIAYAGSYTTSIAIAIAGGAPMLEAQSQSATPAMVATASTPLPLVGTTTLTPRPTPTAVVPMPTPAPPSVPEPASVTEAIVADGSAPTPEPVTPAAPPAQTATFPATDRIGTTQAVNLRTGPAVTAPTQGVLPTGTRLAATGAKRSVAGVLWRQFTLADGRTGWVRDLDVLPVAH